MADAHANFAITTVATAPSPATSGTSLVVATGKGALFPAAPFNVTIWPTATAPLSTNSEIARCTAVSTDTLTITRAQEGTSARTVIVGDQISATITKKTLTDIEPGALGIQQVIARSSDSGAISNSAALTADDTLLWAVSGNSADVWYFEALLLFTTGASGAASDLKIGWTVPTGTTMKWGDGYVAGASSVPGSMTTGSAGTQVATYTAATSRIYPGGNGADVYAYSSGWVYVGGTSGNVNLTWAQNTATVDNLKLQKGSLLRLVRVV